MRKLGIWWCVVAMSVAFCVFGLVSTCGGSDGSAAIKRLEQSTASALGSAPILRAVISDLEADEAGLASEQGAGTPWIEYTREGIGPSFDRQPNSQDTLGIGIPFNGPGQGSKARLLAETAGLRSVAMRRVAELTLVELVSGEWLKIAALADRLEVVRNRLELLNKAVRLQQKRFELGEVSGTEVVQLELARAAEASKEAGLDAEARACRRRLEALCGGGCLFPGSGDLATISDSLGPMETDFQKTSLQSAPGVRGVLSDQAVAQARADLTSATIWGRPAFGIEWERIPSMDGVEGFDALGVLLSVPLPFGRSGKRQVEEAEARSRAANARVEAQVIDTKAELGSALSEAQGAKMRLEALRPVLNKLERTEFSLGQQFRLGAISYLVFIDGLARLDGIRLEAVDAHEQLLLSRLRLAVLIDDSDVFPLPPGPSDPSEEK